MIMKYFICKKQVNKQLGFFDLGIGLGLFLLFSGVGAVITTTSDNDSKETVAMQKQTAQNQYYVAIDPEC